jgi:phosphate transport system protein
MILDKDIQALNEKCLKMCSFAEDNLKRSLAYYSSLTLPEDFLPIDDDTVDDFERVLESTCLNLLMTERPYAGNMRMISGILKVVEDIERIGDHAEDVAEWTTRLKNVQGAKTVGIETMCRIALEMVDDAFLAFARNDEHLATTVEKEDDVQDSLYEETIQKLIKMDQEEGANHAAIIYSTVIAKYLERISDHAVNVAEWAIYVIKGYHKDKQIF